MKKILSTLAIILAGTQVFAIIRTCNNNNPSPGQYSTLASAVSVSNSGDTIYLSGSPTEYSFQGNTLTEGYLTFIGTGYNPQKQNANISKIAGFTLDAPEAKLIGIQISGTENIIIDFGYLKLIRCNVNDITEVFPLGSTSDLRIENSIVRGEIDLQQNSNNVDINNSIIYGRISLKYFDSGDELINNVFLYNNGAYFLSAGNINGFAIVKNNIFYGSPNISFGGSSPNGQAVVTFNISNTYSFPDNDGNNIVSNPLFVNVPFPIVPFSYTHDFHLQPTSPALLNPGDDGLQRGIYGSSPPKTFVATGMPGIPSIQTMSMPSSVLSGQSIQVNFSSKTNQ